MKLWSWSGGSYISRSIMKVMIKRGRIGASDCYGCPSGHAADGVAECDTVALVRGPFREFLGLSALTWGRADYLGSIPADLGFRFKFRGKTQLGDVRSRTFRREVPIMKRNQIARPARLSRQGYTMVELLTATTLALIMMLGVITILGTVGRTMNETRAALEMADRLRATRNLLQRDLEGLTVRLLPPRRPEFYEGYFEYIEGPVGPAVPPEQFAINMETGAPDTSVIDFDDILMFTTRRIERPFVGRFGESTIESPVAEVAWFVRGNVLYRRVLLVAPWAQQLDLNNNGVPDLLELGTRSVYDFCDLSVRRDWSLGPNVWYANSLGDLTNRENRYAHQNVPTQPFPYEASIWGLLGLPTLEETSHPAWMTLPTWTGVKLLPLPHATLAATNPDFRADLWLNPYWWAQTLGANFRVDSVTGILEDFRGPRAGEDVVLTNVIGFDVKVWDPLAPVQVGPDGEAVYPGEPGFGSGQVVGYGAFVDLGVGGGQFGVPPNAKSGLGTVALGNVPRTIPTLVYDTWSLFYEFDGRQQFAPIPDAGLNGFDDNNDGVVDDPDEFDTLPPYPHQLRAIQIRIRIFEPDTKQIRQVTLVHSFLPGLSVP